MSGPIEDKNPLSSSDSSKYLAPMRQIVAQVRAQCTTGDAQGVNPHSLGDWACRAGKDSRRKVWESKGFGPAQNRFDFAIRPCVAQRGAYVCLYKLIGPCATGGPSARRGADCFNVLRP